MCNRNPFQEVAILLNFVGAGCNDEFVVDGVVVVAFADEYYYQH